MAEIEQAKNSVQDFNKSMRELERLCAPLKELREKGDFPTLNKKQLAHYNSAIAYSIHATMWMYFKVNGVPASYTMQVKKELERIKDVMKRLKASEGNEENTNPSRVDQVAAKRMVAASQPKAQAQELLASIGNENTPNESSNKISPSKRKRGNSLKDKLPKKMQKKKGV